MLIAYRECQVAFLTPRHSKIYPKWWMDRHVNRKSAKLDQVLKGLIRDEFNRKSQGLSTGRSAMALSLADVDVLTPAILQQTSDTLRGFLFAGHDTTSILMQWAFYELGRRPAALQALRDELDEVFGPDPTFAAVKEKIVAPGGEKLMTRLPCKSHPSSPSDSDGIRDKRLIKEKKKNPTDTDAIVKEILRLYPPGGTARMAPMGSNTTLTLPDGKQLVVDGMTLAPIAKIIQRDPAIFGDDADEFKPERWLGQHNIPDSAWRPYERGPRRCTGSELANMEARLILACAARQYDFVKTGLGELEVDEKTGKPILDEKGYAKTKSTLFTVCFCALEGNDNGTNDALLVDRLRTLLPSLSTER